MAKLLTSVGTPLGLTMLTAVRAELAGVRVSNFGSLHHRCAGRRCGLRLMQPPARDPIALVNILDLTADRPIFFLRHRAII